MKTLVFGLFLLMCAAPASAGLQLSIRDGRVTLDAEDVTVRQILVEWARVGKTRLVNVERITGGPVTLKLENVPEKQALETILRAIPGYMAVPRQALVAGASVYDAILLMPTTSAVAAARPQPPPGLRSPLGGANVTQLRTMPPMLTPGVVPEPEPAADPADDPAIAAAAAAGLIPVSAPAPGPTTITAPLVAPGGPNSNPAPPPETGAGSSPLNPWNAPTGSSSPTFTPPPPPPSVNAPVTRTRPPLPDR